MEKPKIKAKPLFLTDKPDKRSSSLSDDSCESVEGASIAGKRVSASVQRQLNRAFRNLPRFEASLDSDGNRIKYDIREDEEQFEKCSLILQTLLEAGYFRATIKGLSDFDKVVVVSRFISMICITFLFFHLFRLIRCRLIRSNRSSAE